MILLHVITADAWAVGPPATPEGGFLHLCTPEQLPFVLARHFAGHLGLVVLHLDPAVLDDVRWEASEAGMDPFPHLYGPFPASAIRSVTRLPPGATQPTSGR